MRLDEFRAALESDATKRADEQERTIKRLLAEINDRDNTIAIKEHEIENITKQLNDVTLKLMKYERPRIDFTNPNALTTLMMLGSMWIERKKE